MFILYLLVIVGAVAIAFAIGRKAITKNEDGELHVAIPRLAVGLAGFVATAFVGFTLLGSFGQIGAGKRGVVLRFGAVTGEVKNEGLYFVTPFVERVVRMDVQVHADKSKATAASHDLQNVSTEITVNYRLDAKQVAKVYQDLGNDYVARVMVPAIAEAVKSSTAQFDAERLVIERPQVKSMIEEVLQQRLTKHGMIVDGIAITDFQFSPDFAAAIEAKVTSQQLALKAKNDVEIVRNKQQEKFAQAQADSYVTVTNAIASAKAIKISSEAISAQGGKDYVTLQAINKWDGSVPQWVTGSGTSPIPFLNVGGK